MANNWHSDDYLRFTAALTAARRCGFYFVRAAHGPEVDGAVEGLAHRGEHAEVCACMGWQIFNGWAVAQPEALN